jgi:hypothetical protein
MMADGKKDMQADGSGSRPEMPDGNGELASRRDADMPDGTNPGESGGGPYPNPHDGSNGQEPPADLDERRR